MSKRTRTKRTVAKRTQPPKAASASSPVRRFGLGFAALLFSALSLAYFLPALMPGTHLFGTDYYAASYFYMEWLSHEFARGAIPKWLPYVYGGVPWFANPGATWYPPRLLGDLFLPAYKLFAFMYFVQVAAAGIGAFLLCRELRCRAWAAFVAALSFQFTGVLLSHVFAGHDGRMIVMSLAPMFLFFLHRGVRTGGIGAFAGASATLGLCMLSNQIQTTYYLLLAGALWSLFALWHHGFVARGRMRALGRRVALGLAAVALAFALAAVNFLPFLGYVEASPRGGGGRGYEYATSWSMAPGEIASMAVPEQAGILQEYRSDVEGANPSKLHTEYVGAFVLALLALGAFYGRRDRRWWFFLGLALFALTISLGGHTPIYRLYYALLPGVRRFRAPNLAFYLIALSLSVMAGLTLERLAALREGQASARSEGSRGRRANAEGLGLGRARWLAFAPLGLAILGAMIGPGLASAASSAGQGWLRFATFSAAIGACLWLWLGGRVRTLVAASLLSLVVVADLWIVDRRFYEITPAPGAYFRADGVANFLSQTVQDERVWVLPGLPQLPAYHASTNYLMKFDVAQITGEHGNQLQRWNEYLGASQLTYTDLHNVLGELQRFATSGGAASTPFLDAAAVGYVVASANVRLPWPIAFEDGSGVVYANPSALPRAYLVPEARVTGPEGTLDAMLADGWNPARVAILEEEPALPLPAGTGPAGRVQILEHASDRFLMRAEARRPSILVVAENHYPDWQVRVDGEPAPLLRVDHALMGVALRPGEHAVELAFRPAALYRGLWISAASVAVLLAAAAWSLWAARRTGTPEENGAAPA